MNYELVTVPDRVPTKAEWLIFDGNTNAYILYDNGKWEIA